MYLEKLTSQYAAHSHRSRSINLLKKFLKFADEFSSDTPPSLTRTSGPAINTQNTVENLA